MPTPEQPGPEGPGPDRAPSDGAEPTAAHCTRILRSLLDMGHRLAALTLQQAEAEAPTPTRDHPADFERTARAVRRTALLLDHLAPPTHAAAPAAVPLDRLAARKQLIRTVEDQIQATHAGPDAQALHQELCDRLDSPDLDDDLQARPLADVVTDIVRDLGLADVHPFRRYKRRTPAEAAILHARAARTGNSADPALRITFPPRPLSPDEQRAFDHDMLNMLAGLPACGVTPAPGSRRRPGPALDPRTRQIKLP